MSSCPALFLAPSISFLSFLLLDCRLSPLQVKPLPSAASKQRARTAQMPGPTHYAAQAAAPQGLHCSSSLAVLETPCSYKDLTFVLSGLAALPSPLRPRVQQHVSRPLSPSRPGSHGADPARSPCAFLFTRECGLSSRIPDQPRTRHVLPVRHISAQPSNPESFGRRS